jgi:hypothetical protein
MDTGGEAPWCTAGRIAVFDYPGRRAEARVAEMRLESEGLRTDYLLERCLPTEVTAASYAGSLFARRGRETRHDAAVMAYCASAAAARAYVECVHAESGVRPPLICYDGGPSTAGDIRDCYASAVRQISKRPPSDVRRPVDVASLLDRPHALVRAVHQDLTERAVRSLRDDGLGEEEAAGPVAQLVQTHVSWLSHLLAAYHFARPAETGPVLNVLSADQPSHDRWFGSSRVTTVRIPCSRAELLRYPQTRSIVLEFMAHTLSGK